jgi:hypothetical protein
VEFCFNLLDTLFPLLCYTKSKNHWRNLIMNQSTIKLIANSKFAGFTMARLDKRYDILTGIITDPDATSHEIKLAAIDREEVEACIQLFIQEDVDDPTATPAMILEVVTGTSIEKLMQQTPGGILAQDIVEKTTAATKATSRATKKGINSFATWLATKTS